MTEKTNGQQSTSEKPSVTLPGTVEKIIPAAPRVDEPEKAQISLEGADHLYREIRVENVLKDENGNEVQLKEGARVDVTIEAEPNDTKTEDTKAKDTKTKDTKTSQ